MKDILTINDNGIYNTLGYTNVEVNVPEVFGVDSIEDKKGDIALGNNLKIEEKVLSDTENILEGTDVDIRKSRNTFKINVTDMRYNDKDIKAQLNYTLNRLKDILIKVNYIYAEQEKMFYDILLTRFNGKPILVES